MYYLRFYPDNLKETTKSLIQNGRSMGNNSKSGPPDTKQER
jgi:hypothetical protein